MRGPSFLKKIAAQLHEFEFAVNYYRYKWWYYQHGSFCLAVTVFNLGCDFILLGLISPLKADTNYFLYHACHCRHITKPSESRNLQEGPACCRTVCGFNYCVSCWFAFNIWQTTVSDDTLTCGATHCHVWVTSKVTLVGHWRERALHPW